MRLILMGLAIPSLVACNHKTQGAGQGAAPPADAAAAAPASPTAPPTPEPAPATEATPSAGGADQADQTPFTVDLRAAAPNYALPVPEGARGTSHDSWVDGRRSHTLTFDHPCSADQLAASYDEAMKAKGLEVKVKRTEGAGKIFRSFDGSKPDVEASALVANRLDRPDRCSVTLRWSEPAAVDVATALASTIGSPADFPLPLPAGVDGDFTDHADSRRRLRSVKFRDGRSHRDLAALYEKAMKQQGLEPQRNELSQEKSRITMLSARRQGIQLEVTITTPKSGPSELFVHSEVPAK